MTKEEDNFMDSYEDNNEIKTFIEEVLKDKHIEAVVDYHYYSDGKHRVELIETNEEEHENRFIQVKASTTREDLKKELICIFTINKPTEDKFARKCSECGKLFNEGYCIGGGSEYFCSDECLHKNYTKEEWEEMYNKGNSDNYWTSWECEEDFEYYADGTEIEENEEEQKDTDKLPDKNNNNEWDDKCPKCKSDKVDWVDSPCIDSEKWICNDCKHEFNLGISRTRYYEDK